VVEKNSAYTRDLEARLEPVADFAALGVRWREFEAAATGSFFQSWTWAGCLAAARFPHPWLLRVTADGRDVALGLFNRRRTWWGGTRLFLGESGDPAWDAVFIEENGLLLAGEAANDAAVIAAGLAALGGRRVVLSGVDGRHLAAAARLGGQIRATRTAPFVDLATARAAEGGFLAGRSANTRYQLRRSARSYATRGALSVRRAADVAEAEAFLDALAVLHQRSWVGRGKPGAFANPRFRRFHRELIARGHPRGEIDLLRVSAGETVFGYLYNFLWRGAVATYQSGFDFAAAGPHEKPGLTAHHLAIEHYAALGATRYDFLAGAARYKTSLADAERPMHWLVMGGW
jgi:CelD/BcsL family acetyltransferase involved in cellulose biosynthesis